MSTASFTVKITNAQGLTQWYPVVWDVAGMNYIPDDGMLNRSLEASAHFFNIPMPLTGIIVNGLIGNHAYGSKQAAPTISDGDVLVYDWVTKLFTIEGQPPSYTLASFSVATINDRAILVDSWYPALRDVNGTFRLPVEGTGIILGGVAHFASVAVPVSKINIRDTYQGTTSGVAEGGPFDVKDGDIIVFDWATKKFSIGYPSAPSKGLGWLVAGGILAIVAVAAVLTRSK